MTEAKPVLAFLGLGLMGAPMTGRLLDAGYEVHVWNRTLGKAGPLLTRGAEPAPSPRAAAEAADIVFMCVLDTNAVEEVVFGAMGVAEAPGRGKVLVDHSSIRPDATREMAIRLKGLNGMGWIDAPVSGGVRGAEEGSLAVMAGGDKADFDKVTPVVAQMAARFTLMGPSGAGQTTKLCNQVIAGVAFNAVAEAVRLASNAGVDASRLPEALAGGFADSRILQLAVPRMLQRPETPAGTVATILKDLNTALELGGEVSAPMPVAAAAQQVLRLMVAQGHGQSEPSILYELYGADLRDI